jgi:NAD+ synthase (glutamine-hydrolysing)
MEQMIVRAEGQGVEILVFPELSVTGYSCQDLFRQQLLVEAAEQSVMMLLDFTRQLDVITIVGVPLRVGNLLLNCPVVLQKGAILSIVPK